MLFHTTLLLLDLITHIPATCGNTVHEYTSSTCSSVSMISVLYEVYEWDAVMSNYSYFECSGWPDSVFTLANSSTNSSVWKFGLVLTGLCGLTPGFCCVDAALACEFVTSLCVSFGTTLHLLYQHSCLSTLDKWHPINSAEQNTLSAE